MSKKFNLEGRVLAVSTDDVEFIIEQALQEDSELSPCCKYFEEKADMYKSMGAINIEGALSKDTGRIYASNKLTHGIANYKLHDIYLRAAKGIVAQEQRMLIYKK